MTLGVSLSQVVHCKVARPAFPGIKAAATFPRISGASSTRRQRQPNNMTKCYGSGDLHCHWFLEPRHRCFFGKCLSSLVVIGLCSFYVVLYCEPRMLDGARRLSRQFGVSQPSLLVPAHKTRHCSNNGCFVHRKSRWCWP